MKCKERRRTDNLKQLLGKMNAIFDTHTINNFLFNLTNIILYCVNEHSLNVSDRNVS